MWRHSQVVRHGSAKPWSPVRVWVPPPSQIWKDLNCMPRWRNLVDAKDLKSFGYFYLCRFESGPRHQPSLLRSYGWRTNVAIEKEMYYVYILQSINSPGRKYVGKTTNLKQRLYNHNSGNTSHTRKYKPWEMILHIALKDEAKAIEFEKYLKSCSGRAFARKRLWWPMLLFKHFL